MDMHFQGPILDDILYCVLEELISRPFSIKTTRGQTCEIIGAQLILENPLARLSRTETKGTVFSALGELLWYLSKENELDFITHYISKYDDESEDGETVYGGYGPRLFNFRGSVNQISNVLHLLKNKPNTRRAVIQIFDSVDLQNKHVEIPCTTTLQFLIRDSKLNLFVTMRSNDAFLGLPHDIFAFTMLQEIFARSLDVELGMYYHNVGSLHLYDKHKERVKQYLTEGHQSTKNVMPEMPKRSPWEAISQLLSLESQIRKGSSENSQKSKLDDYWQDLVRLLEIHKYFKTKNLEGVQKVKNKMISSIYNTYIETRQG